MKTIQQLHQRIPGFKQMLYGKDKSMYVPSNFSQARKRQYIFEQMKKHSDINEYMKFTTDIRSYNFKKPYPISVLKLIPEIDFDEDQGFSYIYYDVVEYEDTFLLIYFIRYRNRNYICMYEFKRYFNTFSHPGTSLLYCISFEK